MLQDSLKLCSCSRLFEDASKTFEDASRSFEMPQAHLKMPQGRLRCLKNVWRCLKHVWKCFKVVWDASRSFEDASRSFEDASRSFEGVQMVKIDEESLQLDELIGGRFKVLFFDDTFKRIWFCWSNFRTKLKVKKLLSRWIFEKTKFGQKFMH